jgi:hypothetical protein
MKPFSPGTSQRGLSPMDDMNEEKKGGAKARQQVSSIGSKKKNGL